MSMSLAPFWRWRYPRLSCSWYRFCVRSCVKSLEVSGEETSRSCSTLLVMATRRTVRASTSGYIRGQVRALVSPWSSDQDECTLEEHQRQHHLQLQHRQEQ
eukprot:UN13161